MSPPIDIQSTPGPVQTEGSTTYRIDTVHYRGKNIDRRVHVARVNGKDSPEFGRPEDAVSWARRNAAPKPTK